MSDMPEKIYAEPPRVAQVGWSYWYPQDNSKYIEQTSYTRTDLVDELIGIVTDSNFYRGRIWFDKIDEAIAKIRATPTGETE